MKKILSFILATLLVVMALPMGMIMTQAATTNDITTSLKKILLQDLTNFEPWSDNIWYNTGMAKEPVCNADKGLFFSQTGTDGVVGEANLKVKALKARYCGDAKYLAVTFQKNDIQSFKAIFSFDTNIGWGWVGLYGAGDPNVYYDNGSAELQKATYTVTGDNNKEFTFNAGTASTVVAYIPMESLKIPNGADITADLLETMELSNFGIQFTDMGNKGTEIENKDAVSVRELTMYNEVVEVIEDDPTIAGDAYTSKCDKVILQDFSGVVLSDLWYNPDLTNTPAFSRNDKGLYISNDGEHHGSANIKINKLNSNDISNAEYLAVTFRKNSITSSFTVKFSFGANGGDYLIKNGAEVYYDNGSATLQATVVDNEALTFVTGTANVVKAYIPVSSICYMWGDQNPIDETAKQNFTQVGMNFIDLGNKDNTAITNENAVSVREISMYAVKANLDVNKDKAINSVDLVEMRKVLLGCSETISFDVNGDAVCNIKDLVSLKKALA